MASTRSLPSLIGVIHLPPLAGAPSIDNQHPAARLERAGAWAIKEAQTLQKSGFEGLIIENFGDAPFYKTTVPPETVASMAIVAAAVREVVKIPIGINVLRNDARSALGIAAVSGCDFIRVNVLSGVAATDQGMIEGCAAELIRERAHLDPGIGIFADVLVKHARALSTDDVTLAIEETALRGQADAIIVTGATTGRLVDQDQLTQASRAARNLKVPLYIGSGADPQNIGELANWVNGFIVGSALRKAGRAGAPLDANRIKAIVTTYRQSGRKKSRTKKKNSPN